MRLQLATIGKLKSGPEKELSADYQTRIGQLCKKAGVSRFTLSEHGESQRATAELRMREEADLLRGLIPAASLAVVLDERGDAVSSAEFAQLMKTQIDAGTADLAIVIGGPDGHHPAFRQSAHRVIALGRMTWPHRLVRVMILEQIYRAFTIMLQHPYHRA